MGNETSDRDFKDLREKFNEILSKVLHKKLEAEGVSQAKICTIIEKKYHVKLNSGSVSKYFNMPSKDFPLFVIAAVCRECNLSIDELVKEVLAETDEKHSVSTNGNPAEDASGNASARMTITAAASEDLITDSSNQVFRGYIGTYYTYFTPTYSGGKDMLKGRLSFRKAGNKALAYFELETNQFHADGTPVTKIYEGTLIYSASVLCCYCILSSSIVGEMCFLMFRHFRLNHQDLECRLATAMTASAGGDDRFPTIHRMLLSREEISEKDLNALAPLLNLNNSELVIPLQKWDELAKASEKYAPIMERIPRVAEAEPLPCYRIRENIVRDVAQSSERIQESDIASFIAELRSIAISSRYNKVSKKSDEFVRIFLKSRGYFSEAK